MVNIYHEEIETILMRLKEDMFAVQEKIDEISNLQWEHRDDITLSVNDAVDSLLELHCDFTDSINELEDAIEDCKD